MSGDNIVVAVKAAKEIPKTALVWALTHIVQPRDSVTLLALVASSSQARFCITRHRRSYSVANADEMSKINDSCSRMIRQLHGIYDPTKISVEIKIIPDSPSGAVATEAKIAQANWVILDRQLKNEKKHCIEKLQSNVVVMKKSGPNVLRLSLVGSSARQSAQSSTSPLLTPSTSPGTFSTAEVSDSNRGVSPLSINGTSKQAARLLMRQNEFGSGSGSVSLSSSVRLKYQPWTREIFGSDENSSDLSSEVLSRSSRYSNLQEVIALSRKAPPGPPPLCSICQLKAPGFGQPPRWFTYAELELATAGFSNENFLAEGGYGSVHRGLLPDGLAIAVKQHKLASTQGDKQFSSEVEVLSRAQHRNVVMLIGFCIEDGRRLLVYEYICNGALDSHLYGQDKNPLSWSARQKIAVGAARGLRYLHEECRVGCIVHRDMRPNNILITHDFEPLVGDFGLARWQSDGQKGVDTRVLGTFGYLAPEYTESGQITEKADVYSFGVVLMELVSGLKAVDINRPRGQHCLSEWARPLLETQSFGDLIDPRLGSRYLENQVYLMLHAASLCLRKDPHTRPRMSQVLRILEGEMIYESRRMNEQDQQVRCFLVTNDSPKMMFLNSPRTSTTDSPRLSTNLLLQSSTDHH